MRARALNQAGIYLSARGDRDGAFVLLEASLPVMCSVQGEESADYATALGNVANRHVDAGRLDKAETAYLRVIEIGKKNFDHSDPNLAITYNNLARLYWKQRAYPRAEPLFLHAIDIMRAAHGPSSFEYASSANSLAALYDDWAEEPGQRHRRAEAARLQQEAVDVARGAVGERHPFVSGSLHNLAILLYRQGEPAAAADLALRAVAIQLSLGLMNHPDTQQRVRDLAIMWNASGRTAPWEPLLLSEVNAVERLMRDWVAEDPANRDFGPPPFADHHGEL